MSFSISKKYKNTCWTDLELLNENDENWEKAILIIKDRFDSRFFKQIEYLENDNFSGFVIMSIDCLLIETIMQFYLGVDNTEINYKGKQWRAFKDFFKQSEHFNKEFKTNEICKIFYQQIRCGLLHQAQTKEKSLIKKDRPNLIEIIEINKTIKGLIIDRKKFHKNLKLEFEDYLVRLSNNQTNFKGENLRINAINKMNFICAE
ncbi:hypothetical protein FPG87_12690 [Flavobacterium psychrophilum]|uniref:hypothetical protein n=1 Tax=Flavobacterium psychrophilum TaxID=96345 RepID=UPI0009033FFD|nr:hypothetical protein [Flavobacterium psychrophilum]EKT4520739.1 hypothetical protein [Flavobacterium psychrophilum]OJH10251.1 hypothetical protein FPG87_12690 [Flavobacterium psychrophilum]